MNAYLFKKNIIINYLEIKITFACLEMTEKKEFCRIGYWKPNCDLQFITCKYLFNTDFFLSL